MDRLGFESVREDDPAALQAAGHALKGAIRYFGDSEAFLQAVRLEDMGRDGHLEAAPAALARLEEEIERLLLVLQRGKPPIARGLRDES